MVELSPCNRVKIRYDCNDTTKIETRQSVQCDGNMNREQSL